MVLLIIACSDSNSGGKSKINIAGLEGTWVSNCVDAATPPLPVWQPLAGYDILELHINNGKFNVNIEIHSNRDCSDDVLVSPYFKGTYTAGNVASLSTDEKVQAIEIVGRDVVFSLERKIMAYYMISNGKLYLSNENNVDPNIRRDVAYTKYAGFP